MNFIKSLFSTIVFEKLTRETLLVDQGGEAKGAINEMMNYLIEYRGGGRANGGDQSGAIMTIIRPLSHSNSIQLSLCAIRRDRFPVCV